LPSPNHVRPQLGHDIERVDDRTRAVLDSFRIDVVALPPNILLRGDLDGIESANGSSEPDVERRRGRIVEEAVGSEIADLANDELVIRARAGTTNVCSPRASVVPRAITAFSPRTIETSAPETATPDESATRTRTVTVGVCASAAGAAKRSNAIHLDAARISCTGVVRTLKLCRGTDASSQL
jgi:hypothetical protein